MDTVVAGALAAFSVDLLIYPLDTLKTRLQAPDYATRFPAGRGLYSGLYQGVGSVIVATLPAAGIFFTTYEHSKSALAGPSSPLHNAPAGLSHLLASSTAELVSCLVLTPAEVIKQRAQVTNRQNKAAAATSSSSSSSKGCPATTAAEAVKETVQRAPSDASKAEVAKEAAKNAADKVTKRAPPGSAAATARQVAEDVRSGVDKLGSSSASAARTGGGGASAAVLRPMASTFARSYMALAGRNLPFTALQFPLYESIRQRLSEHVGLAAGTHASDGEVDDVRESESFQAKARREGARVEVEFIKAGLVSAGSAAVAGSTAALVTTPIDVAKTRIMLSTSGGEAGGVVETMRGIAAKEGWRALFRGGALRSAWTALGAAIYLGSYESGRLWWRDRQARKQE
ncbi:uncharacterized protein PFL1_00170 [Pseudozyma flocculosa PF-1]|uniref:Related to PET8 protein, member of the mitochondrial carrier (MCF) family n=1 Tax=Pseudozyma flocculosa TaxID=84751 RepID=A0A5C3ES85_9BASI|nr:uncharacterized protein PFL1_00170 [Pseudozyma flocculosa PF-1]EPQ31972.1 hypothetical protein PFL1_00170 [Pseudozyma flocculosa PF-1]SPO35108.1 related to PET8 protein, member of the mitochondrial carrier (MCF) family [Pseudozyma flocculosa]